MDLKGVHSEGASSIYFSNNLPIQYCTIFTVANDQTQQYWHALVMMVWPICALMLSMQVTSIRSTVYTMCL